MPKRQIQKQTNPAITIALITLAGTIISAILSSPVLIAKLQNSAPTTAAVPTPLGSTSYATPPMLSDATATANLIPLVGEGPLQHILKYRAHWLPPASLAFQLPDGIDPERASEESLINAINDFEANGPNNLSWMRISSAYELSLDMQNIQGKDGLDIKVENQVKVTVVDYLPTKPHVHALSPDVLPVPVTGGNYDYEYSPLLIDSENWKVRKFISTLEEFDFVTLEPGEIGVFEFFLACKEPGTYLLDIELQVTYAGESFAINVGSDYLNCPETFTLWYAQPIAGGHYKWDKIGDYVLQEGKYSRRP